MVVPLTSVLISALTWMVPPRIGAQLPMNVASRILTSPSRLKGDGTATDTYIAPPLPGERVCNHCIFQNHMDVRTGVNILLISFKTYMLESHYL